MKKMEMYLKKKNETQIHRLWDIIFFFNDFCIIFKGHKKYRIKRSSFESNKFKKEMWWVLKYGF